MPEWTIGTGCKPVGLRPTEVRILLCPPSTDALHECRFTEQSTHNTFQVFFWASALYFTKRLRTIFRVKRCSRCKEEKDLSQFQKNRRSKDGLQDQCKACRKVTDRQTYINRTPEQKARFRVWNLRTITNNTRLAYEYLLKHPCVDCGEADPIVLEFDHVRGEKRWNIADMVRSGRKWERVLEEIEKCEVRCANCHRRITAKRSGTHKYVWYLDDMPT